MKEKDNKQKTYNSLNEFLNDDGTDDNEKYEVIKAILKAEEEKEMGE